MRSGISRSRGRLSIFNFRRKRKKWFFRASILLFLPTCRVETQVSCMLPRMFWSVLLSHLSPCDECIRHLIVVDVNFPDRFWWEVSSIVLASCVCTLLYNMSTQSSACFIDECFFFLLTFEDSYDNLCKFSLVYIMYFITLINTWNKKCSWYLQSVFLIFGVMYVDFLSITFRFHN